MFQEEVSQKKVSIVEGIERVLGDSELANTFALVEVSGWGQLKHGLAYEERHWFKLLLEGITSLWGLTECLISFAVQVFDISGPFLL